MNITSHTHSVSSTAMSNRKTKGKSPVKKANNAVKTIVHTLQLYSADDAGITADDIIEAGSLACGTAIPRRFKAFDVDLVIYSKSIDPKDLLDGTKRNQLLNKLRNCLEKRLVMKIPRKQILRRSLRFNYTFSANTDCIKVNLLISLFWRSSKEFSSFILKNSTIGLSQLSAGASKWQTEFVRLQPERYKEYIKRAKYWKKFNWPGDNAGRPSSFLLTVLVLQALEKSDFPKHKKIGRGRNKTLVEKLTDSLKQIVKNHHHICINMGGVTPSGVAPCVTDPGNSSNNLYYTGFGDKTMQATKNEWDIFAKKIDTLDLSVTFEKLGLK